MDIIAYHDAIPNELCERLIQEFERDPRKEAPLSLAELESRKVGYRDNRRCESLFVSSINTWEPLLSEFRVHFGYAVQRYEKEYGLTLNLLESGFRIAGYKVGEACLPHFDGVIDDSGGPGKALVRAATCIVYLNDVEEGGETVFPRNWQAIRPHRGKILFFPPSFTHPHYANAPLSGPKYVIVTWLLFPATSAAFPELQDESRSSA